jgi:hypothetical protein
VQPSNIPAPFDSVPLRDFGPGTPWSAPAAALALSCVAVGFNRLRRDALASEDADALAALLLDVRQWLLQDWLAHVTADDAAGVEP